MIHFDAIVIGAGPAGATAALLLARAGWDVAVVERQGFPRGKVCGEYLSVTNWPLFERAGIADTLRQHAGPPVREVALIADGAHIVKALPQVRSLHVLAGCAIPREHLDTLLLHAAREAGANIWQPCKAVDLVSTPHGFQVKAVAGNDNTSLQLHAPVVIAAHGSWQPGGLPTQPSHAPPRAGDLFGFKTYFQGAALPPARMPLICFADGYGGMVHCQGERVSFSCCVRWRRLRELQQDNSEAAGDAVLAHVLKTCPPLREVIDPVHATDRWRSSGPLQPGIRRAYQKGVFVAGNAAGEAHPVVAEGISMAMQAAELLVEELTPQRGKLHQAEVRDAIGARYQRRWRKAFATRIRAAATIAHWAMRPTAVQATLPLLKVMPAALSWGARLSGKVKLVN